MTPTVTKRSPRSTASRMRLAARSAESVSSGSDDDSAKFRASFSCRPFTSAWRNEPVRMSHGSTVVTRTPLFASSAARPADQPVIANLLAV